MTGDLRINLARARQAAAEADGEGRLVVSRHWIGKVIGEIEQGRAAIAELAAIRAGERSERVITAMIRPEAAR